MISKSPKEIYQTTHKRLLDSGTEVAEDTVKQFNLFLFGKINNLLMSLEVLELAVPQLGNWKFRRKKGEEFKELIKNKPIGKIMTALAGPEAAEKGVKTYEERIGRLTNLVERHEEMIIARREFKKIKDEYSASKGRSQEQEQDLGRIEEQDMEEGTCGADSKGET